jgi:hypothetical protein
MLGVLLLTAAVLVGIYAGRHTGPKPIDDTGLSRGVPVIERDWDRWDRLYREAVRNVWVAQAAGEARAIAYWHRKATRAFAEESADQRAIAEIESKYGY